jgi:hypothetical protein
LIDASSYSYHIIAALRGAVVPGWENKITVPLTTENVFGKSSPHEVVAPNKVIELREGSLILEKEFEGSNELPFFVCPQTITCIKEKGTDDRNVYLLSVLLSHILCEKTLPYRWRRRGANSSRCRVISPKLRRWSSSVPDPSVLNTPV